MSNLSENLTNLRRKCGVTISQAAEFLDVTPDEVIDWEEGNRVPTEEQINRLAQLYNTDAESLKNMRGKKGFSFSVDEEGFHVSKENGSINDKDYERAKKVRRWNKFPYPMITIIAYLILGFTCNLWHPAWLIFMTIPLYYGLISAIARKSASAFPYPVLCALIYLLLGFLSQQFGWTTSIWAWGTLIFLTIPFYYYIVNNSWKNIWTKFPYPLLCVIIYLVLGFAWGLWHPGWVIFLTIPVFDGIMSFIKNK